MLSWIHSTIIQPPVYLYPSILKFLFPYMYREQSKYQNPSFKSKKKKNATNIYNICQDTKLNLITDKKEKNSMNKMELEAPGNEIR